METRSGLKIPEHQRLILKQELKTKKFEKLSQEQYLAHKRIYNNDATKEQLRQDWEQNTGQRWPVQKIKVIENGQLVKQKIKAQIHHIIPQQHGGPHEGWNAHPLFTPEHQGGVHGSGSTLNHILNLTGQK